MADINLKKFYNSKAWKDMRLRIIAERGYICEKCNKVIINQRDIHCHHKIELTADNVHDLNISLNENNIEVICSECHNKEHNRYGYRNTSVTIVCGAPCSGKTTYVLEHKGRNDIVVDIDRLYEAMTLLNRYDKPDSLKYNVIDVRNYIIDSIRTRNGTYNHAWIIGGYANKFDREKLARELNADIVIMGTKREECIERLHKAEDYRQYLIKEWTGYINEWFEEFIE